MQMLLQNLRERRAKEMKKSLTNRLVIDSINMTIDDIICELLEKENFIIRQAYTYGYDDCGSKMPHDDKSFFNETFNTKER